ncbi:MAG: hypothetical protein KF738_14225 [Burkholderiales bacterium]|nr:hypothetical protein [Burkholderiales bacterium]
MRHIILRALEFGASGGVVVVAANIVATFTQLPQGDLPSTRFWLTQGVIAVAVSIVLAAGAFAGFAATRAHEIDAPSALALGILAGLPAFLVASSLLAELGPIGAIGAALGVTSLIAAVGGGGLRGAKSHG